MTTADTKCACCEAYGQETPATTTAPAIVNDEANGFVRATPGEDLPSCDSCRAETLDALGEEDPEELAEHATRCADEDRAEEAARYEANQAACDRCLESPAVSSGLCASCMENDEIEASEEEAVEITASDLHAFYGVPLPEGWTGAERLAVRPGLCTEAPGEDAAGDLSDLAPSAEQFAELNSGTGA